jgi:hypothetical protein
MFLDMSVSLRQYVLGHVCKGGGSMFLDMSVKVEAVCSWICL